MTNNNKLLYLTVFVAALFVATISGTFAYFQVSISSNDNYGNVITGQMADVTITLSVSKLQPKSNVTVAANGADLIPFDLISTSNAFNTSSLNSAISNGCIDNYNYTACDVFKITVKADNTLKIDGYIKIEAGTYEEGGVTKTYNIPNVKWLLIKSRSTSNYTNIAALNNNLTTGNLVVSNVKPIGVTSTDNLGNSTDGYYFTNLSSNDQIINTTDSYYYFVVWLEDINDLQDDEGTYKGTVTFRGYGDPESKVTASFSG